MCLSLVFVLLVLVVVGVAAGFVFCVVFVLLLLRFVVCVNYSMNVVCWFVFMNLKLLCCLMSVFEQCNCLLICCVRCVMFANY